MRIGKRNLRNRMRYGYIVHFTKRGDRIPHPSDIQIGIEEGSIPSNFLSPAKYLRLHDSFRKHHLRQMDDMRYRRVKKTLLPNGLLVSTVFLTFNHAFREPSIPVLFETMVFGPYEECDIDCCRYTRLSDARKGHRETVMKYRKVRLKPSTSVVSGPL